MVDSHSGEWASQATDWESQPWDPTQRRQAPWANQGTTGADRLKRPRLHSGVGRYWISHRQGKKRFALAVTASTTLPVCVKWTSQSHSLHATAWHWIYDGQDQGKHWIQRHRSNVAVIQVGWQWPLLALKCTTEEAHTSDRSATSWIPITSTPYLSVLAKWMLQHRPFHDTT